MFASTHLPDEFAFPDDPSHLKAGEARRFLEFIRERQQKVPEDIFEFQYWIDAKDKLQAPVESGDEEPLQPKRRGRAQQAMPKPTLKARAQDESSDDTDTDESAPKGGEDGRSIAPINKGKGREVQSPSAPYSDWADSDIEEDAGELPRKSVAFKVGARSQGM